MIETNTTYLTVDSLESPEGIFQYNKALKKLEFDNPYYCLELIAHNGENQELMCFYYYEDDELLALMPFLIRAIFLHTKKTQYCDISSPYGCNGPLYSTKAEKKTMTGFWKRVDDWYQENKVVTEFIRFNFDNNHLHYTGEVLHSLYAVKGNISNWEVFWKNLKSSTRNQFRKAEKNGLVFKTYHGNIPGDKIEQFYQLYIETMDRRKADASFYHELSYFEDFCKNHKDIVAISLVYKGEIPVSGIFFLLSKKVMYSYLGATNADYFKIRPNEYLKIRAIEWAHKNGMHYYLIGGGRSDGDNLYLYKKKFFSKDQDAQFFTGRKIVSPEVYSKLVSKVNRDGGVRSLKDGFFPQYREMI